MNFNSVLGALPVHRVNTTDPISGFDMIPYVTPVSCRVMASHL